MKCMYCGEESLDTPIFVVRKATKPKRTPYRWQKIGYCCDDCENKGRPTTIENTFFMYS